MSCKRARSLVALKAVDEVWRIADYSVERILRRVLQNVAVNDSNSVVPWRIIYISCGLSGGLLLNLDTGYGGAASLCCHNGDESASASNVQNPLAGGAVEPTAEQATIGSYLHGAIFLLNGELLESEITVRHPLAFEMIEGCYNAAFMSRVGGSNPRPTRYECVALPTELIRHLFFVYVAFRFAECFPPDLPLVKFWTNALLYQLS